MSGMAQTPRKPGGGRKPGGRAYPHTISVPVSDEARRWLDDEAARRRVTVAALIRTLIEQARTPQKLPRETPWR
jgi:hypothetical protein